MLNYMDSKNPRAGGAEKYCHEMAKRLAQSGFEVLWISSHFEGAPKQELIEGYRVRRIGNIYTVHLLAIVELLKAGKIDIIFESINGVPFPFTFLFRSKKARMIHHIVPYGIIKQKVGLLAPLVFFIQNKLTPLLYKRSLMVAGSRSVGVELKLFGFRNIRFVMIGGSEHSGIFGPKNRNLAVSAGPIKPWKRFDHVIRAFASLSKDWHLAIFGRFESEWYEIYLGDLVKKLGLDDRVRLLGYVDERTKWKLYREAKVLVVASEKEGWGLAAMEAQSCGTPVVGYDVPGIRDSVRNEKTGILVKDGDLEELKRALKRISADPRLLDEYSRNAAQRSRDYTWEKCYSEFEMVIRSLLTLNVAYAQQSKICIVH